MSNYKADSLIEANPDSIARYRNWPFFVTIQHTLGQDPISKMFTPCPEGSNLEIGLIPFRGKTSQFRPSEISAE